MASPGGTDDIDAEVANLIRADDRTVDAGAGLPHIRNSIGEEWGSAVELASQLAGRLHNLTPVNGGDGTDVSDLRREVRALTAKVEELAAGINELRETVAKVQTMEEANWPTNNDLLDKLYKAVVSERQPKEIRRREQTATRRSVASTNGGGEKPVGRLRRLFNCMR